MHQNYIQESRNLLKNQNPKNAKKQKPENMCKQHKKTVGELNMSREHDHERRLEIPHNLDKCLSKAVVFEPSYGRLSARTSDDH